MGSKLWCFTNFNLEFDYKEAMHACQYIAYGLETCPTTGKQHHQGWLWLICKCQSPAKVAKIMGKCHVERCNGNIHQNDEYCSKEGKLVEFGTKPQPGERKDLKRVRDEIVAGRPVDEITMENPAMYHSYGRTMEKLEDIMLRKKFRTEMTEGIWYWGGTGVGKSHTVFADFDPATTYVVANDNGWWDGYTGQETVIFNEFRGGVAFAEMLDLVDKWPKTVARRGREPAPFLAKRVLVTSSMHPEEVYKNVAKTEAMDQLLRRFQIRKLTRLGM